MVVVEYFEGIGKNESHQKAVRGGGRHDIKENLIKSGGDAVSEYGLSESSDDNDLKEWPEGDKDTEQGIEGEGRSLDGSGKQGPETRQQQPAEKDQ